MKYLRRTKFKVIGQYFNEIAMFNRNIEYQPMYISKNYGQLICKVLQRKLNAI